MSYFYSELLFRPALTLVKLKMLKNIFLFQDTTPLLMVVGGSNADGIIDDVELISPKPNEECSNAISPLSGLNKTKLLFMFLDVVF